MTKNIAPEDLYQLRSVSQVRFYDNKIFFTENFIKKDSNSYLANLVSLDQDKNYRVWSREGLNSSPRVLGDFLYYLHQEDGEKPQLYRMPIDGGSAQPFLLTDGKDTSVQELVVSNDAQALYVKSKKTQEKPKFKTEKFPEVRHVTKLNGRLDGYGWFENDAEFSLIKIDKLMQEATVLFTTKDDFELAAVAKAGTNIAYIRGRQPELDTDIDYTKAVYLYNEKTGKTQLITTNVAQGSFSAAAFSPDGKTLALVGNDNSYPGQTINDLWLYSLETKQLTNLTQQLLDIDVGYEAALTADFTQNLCSNSVVWLDNKQYVFTALHHGHSQLYLGNRDTVQLIRDEAEDITDFCAASPQKLLLTVSKQALPSELLLFDLKTKTTSQLYNPNHDFERTHSYLKAQKFTYLSKDKTQELEGWYLPAANKPKQSPVLLYVHGGPHAAYGEAFFHEFQVLASWGYGIVYVNPRGSTTYGQKFCNDVDGHYGENDFSDVLAGLDYALEHFPELDKNHQYIAGGSYGGFMTTWAVGHTKRFKAAVAQRCVSDWISMNGTSDIGYWFDRQELQANLFSDNEALKKYWRMSPLAYAQNVTTPIRLLHGEWDMRCPISQSEEFFTAVKLAGAETDMIRYPQSFHGVSRNGLPSLRIHRMHDIKEWFDKHQ
ncbi:S9 family peptidase [Lactobacillus sp. ESL0677]|uniref:S9 family peptidase n=1 Tax=Lactobacillus sp. ESL0677 TaxID=2983208 RepID=UPI0023F95184|nr:S9 family peptidase [Lactobacillus sp. ESL0677]WEV37882.1 S9 family peptidase [Lactobacillus sp. ESL0677]